MRTNRHDPPYPIGGGSATVGQLIEALQSIAVQHGYSTPVVTDTLNGDYEQCALPFTRRAKCLGESIGWHVYREDPEHGQTVVVLV